MDNYRAIPKGYMTVGEVAKKMNVSVRTLQYYDRVGLLPPTALSEGGRRLYTDKDILALHQILSLKSLGFSLEDIKNRLFTLDTPNAVAAALDEQAALLRKKIAELSDSLKDIEALKSEVLKMQCVDYKKYADIIVNLQMKNENYRVIKYFDDRTLDHIRERFDKESGLAMIATYTRLRDRAIALAESGALPDSEEGLALAEEFWNMVTEFTQGDMEMISHLTEIGKFDGADAEWKAKQELADKFLEPALGCYFDKLGIMSVGEKL